MNDFHYYHYGRYVWAYLAAPFLAALFSAFIAKKHLNLEKVRDPYRFGKSSVVSSSSVSGKDENLVGFL